MREVRKENGISATWGVYNLGSSTSTISAALKAKTIIIIFLLLVTFLSASVNGAQWTELDESKRIDELKKQEKQIFEKEMGGRVTFRKSSEEAFIDYPAAWQERQQNPYSAPHSQALQSPIHNPYPFASQSSSSSNSRRSAPIVGSNNVSLNWCFHCVSPWTSIPSELQQVVKNLLEVRRSAYPAKELVSSQCTNPKHLDALPRQSCLYSYCQTLVLTDHETGTAFTLRGCAEKFGAIDEEQLNRRGDNTCEKLHNGVDIQECICKNRKSCYAGAERRNIHYTENLVGEIGHSRTAKRTANSSESFSTTNLFVLLALLSLSLLIM